eukprot:scaffold27829_cov64-Cyclotella_meneghiniana.AAC.13
MKLELEKVAASALKAIQKHEKRDGVPFDRVPTELLSGNQLDLSQWTLVVTDECLQRIKATHRTLDEGECSHSSSLTLINLSGAEKISDHGLQSISPCCTSALRSLYLDNVFRITGNGLTAITKHCIHLQSLSLPGTLGIQGSSFGIIGQQCHQLITLELSGCRQITPWAFMKIFEGCTKLKNVDISYCSLITDEQIKLLSEKCSDLHQLNLRECKQISDVGLSFLSQGCPSLIELNLRRSELPFRVSDVALLQLGQGCQSLKCLNLHGCEMISDTGISWLASWSKELRHLDLSNCNKITNKGIRHVGEVNLSYCPRIGERGLKALSKCEKLNILDLNGCTGVTDQAILHLCDGEFIPGLRHLYLAGCKRVGDTALSWITDGLRLGFDSNLSLETLSLKGTSITKEAARGISDRFPYSIFKYNASYLGYWPVSRSDDRKVIDAYHKKTTVCTTIQARFRSRREKDTLRLAKEQYCKKRVAIWLGARFRAGKARCLFRAMKRQRKEVLTNTLMIQCAFRIRMSKKKAGRMREKRWAVVTPYASTIIQRHWRGVLGRKRSSKLRARMLEYLENCLQATIRIQAWFRMILAKRLRLLLQCRHFSLELSKFRSSIKIQCFWRTIAAKKVWKVLKLELEEQERLRIASLSRISALVRCRLFRKAIQKRVTVTETRLKASLLIQTWYRNETERVRLRINAEKEHAELRLKQADLIQRTMRKKLAHLELLKLRAEQAELHALKESKATVLCRWMRMCIAKLRLQQRRVEYEEELVKSLVMKIWAATALASAWRGKL